MPPKTLTVACSRDVRALFHAEAERLGVPLSKVIRTLTADGLNRIRAAEGLAPLDFRTLASAAGGAETAPQAHSMASAVGDASTERQP